MKLCRICRRRKVILRPYQSPICDFCWDFYAYYDWELNKKGLTKDQNNKFQRTYVPNLIIDKENCG